MEHCLEMNVQGMSHERKHVLTTSDHVSHTQENEAFIKHSCHFHQTHNTCRWYDSLACSFPTGKLFRCTLTDRRADLPTPWICHRQSQTLAVTYMGNKDWHAERLLSWFWYMRIKLLNNLTIVLRLFIHRKTDHWSERKNKRWKEDKGALSDDLCQVHSTPSHSNTIASDRQMES